jgi:hypothetical protein
MSLPKGNRRAKFSFADFAENVVKTVLTSLLNWASPSDVLKLLEGAVLRFGIFPSASSRSAVLPVVVWIPSSGSLL